MTDLKEKRKDDILDILKDTKYPISVTEIVEAMSAREDTKFEGRRPAASCSAVLRDLLDENRVSNFTEDGRRTSLWYIDGNTYLQALLDYDVTSALLAENASKVVHKKTSASAHSYLHSLHSSNEERFRGFPFPDKRKITDSLARLRFFAGQMLAREQ